MKMKIRIVILAALIVCLTPSSTDAATTPVDATAAISVDVEGIMEWASPTFSGITLAALTTQADVKNASQSLVLYTNGNVVITADQTTASQLSLTAGTDVLVTEYKLEFDGDGTTATGAANTAYTAYNSFLGAGHNVTHVSLDGAVQVTLFAQASFQAGRVADSGTYTATQTLTATWGVQ